MIRFSLSLSLVETTLSSNKPILQPWLHDNLGEEIPYYDEEFDLMQGDPHKDAITLLLPVFEHIALVLNKKFLSDQPAWYLNPDTLKQNRAASDIAISRQFDTSKTTAKDLDIVLEVVTTTDKRKEKKDTIRMYRWNEYNEVSEFCLYFPDVEDKRVIQLFHLKGNLYEKVSPDEKGMLCSKIIPGLCFRELPREKWESGKKVEIWYEGEEIFSLGKERLLRKEEQARRKEAESKLIDIELERWESEKKLKDAEEREKEALRKQEEAEKKAKAMESILKSHGIDASLL